MRMQQILITVVATAGLLGSPLLTLADDGGVPPPPRKEFCKENPGKCEEARQKRAERREFCKANPEKCQEQREQMKAKRAEMQAKCKADPEKCEEMQQEARKKHQDRMGNPPPPKSGPKSGSGAAN